MRDLIEDLREALAGSSLGIGVGFQSFRGPEPGRLGDNVTVVGRYREPSISLSKLIKLLRSKTPIHVIYGKGTTHRSKRTPNS